jgi:prepilin-type N-terminal cleavage/methylation domain-containing protein
VFGGVVMRKQRSGYTLVEVLISLIVISIFFSILVLVMDMTLRAYRISKSTLYSLYANSYVNFLFDVIEGELKWAGSGSTLLVNQRYSNLALRRPLYSPGNAGSYIRPGEVYSEITNHLWLNNSIDIEKTIDGFIIYATYVITYPITLKRNDDGTYSPLQSGYLGASGWAILTTALSPSSDEYKPRYAKLRYYLNGQPFNGGDVSPNDRFTLKEINLAVPAIELDLLSEDKFVYPIARFKNAIFNNGYITRAFRQVRIEYKGSEKKFVMTRFMPTLDLTQQTFPVTLLENVDYVEAYLVYDQGGVTNKIRFDNRTDWNTYKNSSEIRAIKDDIIGIELKIRWKMPWSDVVRSAGEIEKTKFIVLPQGVR